MNTTERMRAILHTENEPSDARYECFNTGGVELETGEFLYGLVRMMKPEAILETGTHKGISAIYMADALKDNAERGHKGEIETIEFLEPNFREAKENIVKMGLEPYVKQILIDAASFQPVKQYGLIFLDTEPQTRFAELVKFYKNLNPGGFLLIHDLHPNMNQVDNAEHGFAWPYGPIPSGMEELTRTKKLIPVHFRTPRGLTMFYKPGLEDHYYEI